MVTGVRTTIDVAQPDTGADQVQAGTFFVAGLTERGDTTAPILVRSMAEARTLLGDRVTYGSVYDQLQAFFGEGGARAFVARVVGPAATKGTLTVNDRAGTPQPTIRFDAASEGAWSTRVSIKIDDAVLANMVKVTVLYDGNAVEIYDNLADPTAIASALALSNYVRAVNLGSATATPNNRPAVTAATPLSAGSDDRVSVTAATLTAALARFTKDYGTGLVAIPGQAYSAISAGLAAHVQEFRRVALMATAQGQTPTQAVTAARTLRALTGAEKLGLAYPWVQIPDGVGGVRTIPPEGTLAGLRARAIDQAGPFRAPAGVHGITRFAVGVERVLTQSEVDTLTDDAVIPIRAMLGGIRNYGWRSLSTDLANWRHLSYADTLNTIAARLEARLERFVGRNIDGRGHLYTEVEGECAAELEPMRAAGGLYEAQSPDGTYDAGYRVTTAAPVNTPATAQAGRVNVRVGLRVAPVGELIDVLISKVQLTASL